MAETTFAASQKVEHGATQPAPKEPVMPVPFGALSDSQLLTYTQAALYLGITPQYLRELKSRRKIRAVELGPKCVRFRVASLNKFILEREVS